eukprot:UN08505
MQSTLLIVLCWERRIDFYFPVIYLLYTQHKTIYV